MGKGKPSPQIMKFMETYGVESDEIWEVHGSTWVVKHKALERVAAEVGIVFDRPSVIACDLEKKSMIVCAFGKLADKQEWSFGEASPANCKNSYFAAMSEKRARDRVILKLLVTHGALYSESEAEEFTQPAKHEATDIIKKDADIQTLTVDAQRPIFSELQKELSGCETVDETKRWKVSARSRASRLSEKWRKILEDEYLKHLRSVEAREAADYIERATA